MIRDLGSKSMFEVLKWHLKVELIRAGDELQSEGAVVQNLSGVMAFTRWKNVIVATRICIFIYCQITAKWFYIVFL